VFRTLVRRWFGGLAPFYLEFVCHLGFRYWDFSDTVIPSPCWAAACTSVRNACPLLGCYLCGTPLLPFEAALLGQCGPTGRYYTKFNSKVQ